MPRPALVLIGALILLAAALFVTFRAGETAAPDTGGGKQAPAGAAPDHPDAAPPAAETSSAESTSPATTPETRAANDRLAVRVLLDGAPLAGAEVHAVAWSDERAAVAAGPAGLPPSVLDAARRALTGEDGTAELSLEGLATDAVFVAARGPGSAPGGRVARLPSDGVTLEVPPEQVMSGGIWTWPDPVLLPGATVLARRAFRVEVESQDPFDPDERVAGMFFSGEAASDDGGIYRIGGLPASRIFMQASAPGRSPSRRVDVFLPATQPITASLLAGGVPLSGSVVDAATGAPLENVTVMAFSKPAGAEHAQWEGEFAVTRSDGRFAVTAPVSGENEVGVSAVLDGYESAHVLAGRAPRDDLVLTLTERPEFRVVLRDEEDGSVSPGQVQLYDRSNGLRLDVRNVDEHGRATFHVDPERPLHVLAIADGYGTRQSLDVRAGDGDHTIVMPRRATVEGRVLGGDGAPVAGARVRLRHEYRSQLLSETWADADPNDGSYRAEGLGLGAYTVHALASGFAPARAQLELESGEEARLDLTLVPGHTIDGVVRDATNGAPIGGARVGLADEFRTHHRQEWLPDATETDAGGAFTIADAPSGEVSLLVEHDAYVRRNVTAHVGPDAAPVEVRLDRPATVTVRLVGADGGPLPARFLAVVKPEHGDRMSSIGDGGVAAIDGVPPGNATVTYVPRPTGSRSFSTRIHVGPGDSEEVVFAFRGGATVRGRVVDSSGLALELRELFVAVEPVTETLGGTMNAAYVQPDGSFVFDHAPAGDLVVSLQGRAGAVSAREVRHVRVLEGEEVDVTFELAAGGLRGRVTDRAGRGVDAIVAVRADGAGRRTWTNASAASDGTFRLLHPPGRIDVAVHAEGFGTRFLSRTIPDRRTVLDERVVLGREALLVLRVTDVDGAPVEDVTVLLTPSALPDARPLFRPRRLDDERLEIDRLGAGRHALEVRAPGTLAVERTFDVAPGAVRRETIRLRRAVDVVLTIADDDGRPLAAEPVRLAPADDDQGEDPARHRAARTDASGGLTFPAVPEGEYVVLVRDRRESLSLRRTGDPVARFVVLLD